MESVAISILGSHWKPQIFAFCSEAPWAVHTLKMAATKSERLLCCPSR